MHRFKTVGPVVLLAIAAFGVSVRAEARSCFSGQDAVNPDQVKADEASIKGNPGAWFAGKGGGLAKAVRDLAGSDPDFAATIVSQHKGAPTGVGREQASAIGAGLGQANLACKPLIDEAGKIQTAASSSSEDALVASFNTTIGSAQSGSTGGGGAGGGGDGSGIGGPSTTASSGSGSGGSRSDPAGSAGTANRFANLLTSSSGASVSGVSVTQTSLQAAQAASVNP